MRLCARTHSHLDCRVNQYSTKGKPVMLLIGNKMDKADKREVCAPYFFRHECVTRCFHQGFQRERALFGSAARHDVHGMLC
jgi:hypothetical protein